MSKYSWPPADKRRHIGKHVRRVDGAQKVTGTARYTSDIRRPGLLYAKLLHCPHAHARIVSVDPSRAERMPGVHGIRLIQEAGAEIHWYLDEIAVVAAEREEQARDALEAIQIVYEPLEVHVDDRDADTAPEGRVQRANEQTEGDPDGAFDAADVVSEGVYGLPVITHCSLESHGQVCEWDADGKLTVWDSTQGVTSVASQYASALQMPAPDVRLICEYMGGGFGAKHRADRWGIEVALLARQLQRPIQLMLERDAELCIAGTRPSSYARVKLGARRDGTITAWESDSWGTAGLPPWGGPPLPYVMVVPDRRHRHSSISINAAGARAWRAPNHPQACLITLSAVEDLAAELSMDPLELVRKNLHLCGERRAGVYAEEFSIAAEMMDWNAKWHPRGQSGGSNLQRGLGLAFHTWGGRGHNSNCDISLHPDGSVQVQLATQDLGQGSRTVCAIVAAETFGLAIEDIDLKIGDSHLPPSGSSGGSTTTGGISTAIRRGSVKALEELFAKVGPALEAEPDQLEAVDGRVRVKGDPDRGLDWKDAAALMGLSPITVRGKNPGPDRALSSSGVCGVQMADVSVDIETGVVRMNKLVAVQDCGLIIDMKTAESQVYGALIQGITYALMEEQVRDSRTGRTLNANMENYHLAGFGDIGELAVHMMTGPGYDDRGVIGLSEPPVVSPGAAISNAVANAIGVRVAELPLTPARVLGALRKERS